MTELYYSPRGADSNPGTYEAPKVDGTLGIADAKYFEAGAEHFPSGRVKAAQQICAYGSGAPPRLNGRNVVDIGIDLIDNTGTGVSDLEIYGYLTHGVHGGLKNADPLRKRSIPISRLYIHDINGGPESCGLQMWGAGITYTDLLVERVWGDKLWHNGADLTCRRVRLLDTNTRADGKGYGDGLQAFNVSSRVDVRGLVVVHFSFDKQAILLSGPPGSMIPNGACTIDGLSASGYSSGAGLVTIQGLRGIVGTNWNIDMPMDPRRLWPQPSVPPPANAGISFIDGAAGKLTGASLVGNTGAVAVRTSGGPVILATPTISRIGWAPGGVV